MPLDWSGGVFLCSIYLYFEVKGISEKSMEKIKQKLA